MPAHLCERLSLKRIHRRQLINEAKKSLFIEQVVVGVRERRVASDQEIVWRGHPERIWMPLQAPPHETPIVSARETRPVAAWPKCGRRSLRVTAPIDLDDQFPPRREEIVACQSTCSEDVGYRRMQCA
jgi:hypothetical protein